MQESHTETIFSLLKDRCFHVIWYLIKTETDWSDSLNSPKKTFPPK